MHPAERRGEAVVAFLLQLVVYVTALTLTFLLY